MDPTDRDKYKIENQAGHLLRRVAQKARKNMLDRINVFDLTPMQASALSAIAEQGTTSQNQLGRYIGMEPGNVHGLVNRLREKGLIALARDTHDARHYILSLTPKGEDLVAKVVPKGLEATTATLHPLTPRERTQFIAMLKKLERSMGAGDND